MSKKQYKYFDEIDFGNYAPDLQTELKNMIEAKKIWWKLDQICLNAPQAVVWDRQNFPWHEKDFVFGVGSLEVDWSKAEVVDHDVDSDNRISVDKIDAPKQSKPLTEDIFDTLCTVFQNTVFEEVYNKLSEKYILGRTRIMKMQPRRCLSWHYDYTDRLHYPMKTQEGNIMVIEDEVLHLNKDKWYLTKTGYNKHTAINCSNESRTHLVACIMGEK